MSIFKFISAIFRTIKEGFRLTGMGIEEINKKLPLALEYTDSLNQRAEAFVEKTRLETQKSEEEFIAAIKENPERWGLDTTRDLDEQIQKVIENLFK